MINNKIKYNWHYNKYLKFWRNNLHMSIVRLFFVNKKVFFQNICVFNDHKDKQKLFLTFFNCIDINVIFISL